MEVAGFLVGCGPRLRENSISVSGHDFSRAITA